MSYGTKYRCEWINHFDQACKLDIQKNGYGGAVTDVYCDREPIVFNYEGASDFLLDPIWGTQLVINLKALTNFQFLDLYTNNCREYEVRFYLDNVVKWIGFILPDQYQEEYRCPPYTNSFVATDQLGYLRIFSWDKIYDDTIQYGLKTLRPIDALWYILSKTNINLNLREGINVYETRMISGANKSPLNQCYFHGIAYQGLTYYDVLKDLLQKFGAVLRQRNAEWFIFRPIEAHSNFTTRKWNYTFAGYNYNSYASVNLVKDSTTAPPDTALADLIRIANGTMSINPGWKRYTLLQDYKIWTNRLLNGDFTLWTAGVPDKWNIHRYLTYQRSGNKIKLLAGIIRKPAITIFQQINTLIEKWNLKIKYNVFVPAGMVLTVYMRGVAEVFNNSAGTGDMMKSITFDQVIDSTPYTGFRLITIAFEAPVSTSISSYIEIDDVCLVPMYQDGSNIIPYDENSEEIITIDERNNYDFGELEIITGDCPTLTGFRDVYRSALFLGFDTVFNLPTDQTAEWTSPEMTGSLKEILKFSIGTIHKQPQQVISVPVYSKLLDSCSIIKDVDNADRLFLIKRGSWSPKYGRWDVEAHEIAVLPQALLDSDGNPLVDADGNILYG